jgi:HD-GYP domain-containing protein (c-di-GMP phosphodiesterase class II)
MKILEPLDFLKDVSICIGQHHERVDGLGYPFGIPSRQLLVESRILAIADAFDAMTSDRPYRKAMSREEAVKELLDNAGKQHDADLVSRFVRLVKKGAFGSPEELTEVSRNPALPWSYPFNFLTTGNRFSFGHSG